MTFSRVDGFAKSGCRSGEILELLAKTVLATINKKHAARRIMLERFAQLLKDPIKLHDVTI